MRLLSFDIELSDIFELEKHEDMEKYAPFHISVAATAIHNGEERVWFSADEEGCPALNLTRERTHDLLEYLDQMQQKGLSKLAAIKESAATRLRPVLMTTGATVMGHFPLVVVSGAGAEARNSIGIVLVAGMLIGTMFTLFILPSVYLWLAEVHVPILETEAASEPPAEDQQIAFGGSRNA